MSGLSARLPERGHPETALERGALIVEAGAQATGAVACGGGVAAAFGDGAVRFFQGDAAPIRVAAHRGVVLAIAALPGERAVLTGGDDGRCLRVGACGAVEEVAAFGSRWVDCVAAGPASAMACSSGRAVRVWRSSGSAPETLEHPSTVGGLAFDARARRLAASHYGGATVWERGARRWKARRLAWKGSHGAVAWSPDGRFLVSSMQENALHGWRLRDGADMAMQGYPAKVRGVAWAGSLPWLATSGADSAIAWPFDGRDGPMGRPPVECAHGGKQICTAVAALPGRDVVLAGFQDGAVLASAIDEEARARVLKGSGGGEVTALAVAPDGCWLLIGLASGRVLWIALGAGA